MKHFKRFVSLALALTMVLGFVPDGLPGSIADLLPSHTVEAATPTNIGSFQQLLDFLGNPNNATQDAKLTADIEAEYLPVMQAEYKGTFDGNGHTITLTGDSNGIVLMRDAQNAQKNGADQQIPKDATSWGMFCTLSGTVKNLVLVLEEDLVVSDKIGTVFDSFMYNVSDYKDYYDGPAFYDTTSLANIGIVAGEVKSSGLISQVAIFSEGKFMRSALSAPTVYQGIIAGKSAGTIERCAVDYVQCRSYATSEKVESNYYSKVSALYLGGIVGYTSGTVTDCMSGSQDRRFMADFSIGYSSTTQATQHMGGIAGMNQKSGGVSNCVSYIHGGYPYGAKVDTGTSDKNYWLIATTDPDTPTNNASTHYRLVDYFSYSNAKSELGGAVGSTSYISSNCFAFSSTAPTVPDSCTIDDQSLSKAKAALVSGDSAWTTDANGYLTLKWLVQTPAISTTMLSNNSDASITISMADTTPEVAKLRESEWKYTVTAYLKGQATAPQLKEITKTSGTAAVESVTIEEARTDSGAATYYSGGQYQFNAVVTGTDVDSSTAVSWSVTDEDGTPQGEVTIAGGLLSVPANFYGTLKITATAGGVTSDAKTITVRPAESLTILKEDGTAATAGVSVEQNTKYDFGAEIKGCTDLTGSVSWKVTRANSGSVSAGTSIDANGTLTVAFDETPGDLTVTAWIGDAGDSNAAGNLRATVTVTVARYTGTEKDQTVTLSGPTGNSSVELNTRDTLKLTVDGLGNKPADQDGYTANAKPISVTVSGDSGVLTGSWDANPSTFTAAKAGSATITVKREFTWVKSDAGQPGGGTGKQPDDVTWTYTLKVNVTDPAMTGPGATVENKFTALSPVAGAAGDRYESKSTYDIALTSDATGAKYQFTTTTTPPAVGSGSWLTINGSSINVPSSYYANIQNGTLYLWMYTPGSDAQGLSDSRIVGYNLKDAGGNPSAEPVTGNEWQEGTASQDEAKYEGTIYVTAGTLSLKKGETGTGSSITIDSVLALFPGSTGLAAGELTVTVTAGGLYADANRCEGGATGSTVIGDAAGKPTINPRSTDVLSNYSFTISVPEGSTVYYKIYPGQSEVSSDDYPKNEEENKYTAGTSVSLPSGYGVYTVVAIAYPNTEGGRPSAADVVTYTSDNFAAADAPTLQIDGVAFDSSKTYQNGSTFQFVYTEKNPQGNDYLVYYTLNGTTPDLSTNIPFEYNPESPPTLDFSTLPEITIKAVVYDPDYKTTSAVSTFLVRQRTTIGSMEPSIESGETIRAQDTLTLEFSQDFVDQLGSLGLFTSVEYVEYNAQDTSSGINTEYLQSQGYVESSGSATPIDGVRYLLVRGSTTSLPTVRYFVNDTTSDIASGRTYQYAVCRIWESTDSEGNETTYYRFVNPTQISLSGDPLSTITVRTKAFAPAGITDYADGEETTYTYTVRDQISQPTAIPTTDTQGGTSVKIGSTIALTCTDPDTTIFYTLNGTQPRVEWDDETGGWVTTSESTFRYDENAGVRVPNEKQTVFLLYAIAVSNDDSLETSALATFVYTIEELEKAASPSASPTTDASNPTRLAQGERILLNTTTTNTAIYYTTDGSVPDYEARDEWDAGYAAAAEEKKGAYEDGTRWYLDEYNVLYEEPATYHYDTQTGVLMGATQEKQFFVVTAIAVEQNQETPTHSNSDAVSFTYQLAQTDAPVASPETSTSSVSVIEPNTTITLTSGTVGAQIYYTKDTTLPDVTDPEAVKAAYQTWLDGWNAAGEKERGTDARGVRWYNDADGVKQTEPSTIPYDAAEGITMPKTITTFFTLRAVAIVSDGTRADSDVVTISYQLPEQVQAVYASPIGGTAVEYGASVTLSCSTEDAQIFYKVYESEPGEDDAPVVNQDLSYTEPITITKEVWIQAVATKSGMESNVATYHYTVAPTADSPTVSLPGGSVVPKGTRITLSGEGTIVYTLDGSDPKADGAAKQYGTVVNLDGDYGSTITLRAYIQRDGYTPSDVVSFTYTICAEEDYLNISVDSGSVIESGTSVTLSTAITNGQIFYTLDGSTPQVKNVYTASAGKNYTTYEWASGSSSTLAGSGFTLSGSPDSAVTVRAIVVVNGGDGGQVSTFTYKFQPQAASPTASIPSGAVVFDGATVTLNAKEGTIYYTLDGKDPTTSSSIYTEPIDVSGADSVVLKAMVVVEGKANSAVVEYRYTRAGQAGTPVFSVTSGEIDTGTSVAITSATEGAAIYYSTDGTKPTEDNLTSLTLYVAPISVTRAVTIRAIAVSDTLDPSDVAEATYTVREPVVEPEKPAEETVTTTTVTDRLTSRREYDSAAEGPSYSGVVLREAVCNTVLSAEEGVIPADALLTVMQETPSRSDEAAVNTSLGLTIARVYSASLTRDGDEVTPAGKVEIGFAIPSEYQNGVVTVSRINDDGTLTQYTARRSGGMAYVETDTLGRFALSVPQQSQAAGFDPWWIAGGGALIAAAGLIVFLAARRRRRAEETAAAQPFEDLADFQDFHPQQ